VTVLPEAKAFYVGLILVAVGVLEEIRIGGD
jgi:hypothetical protein